LKFENYEKNAKDLDKLAPVIMDILVNKLFINIYGKSNGKDYNSMSDDEKSEIASCYEVLIKILN
jgi:hypothetical protein